MNERFVGCRDCKKYIDAGYRWAYWTLEEPGIVCVGEPVTLTALLNAKEFWNPEHDEEHDADWLLKRVLPNLKEFLAVHLEHQLIWLEADQIYSGVDPLFEGWEEENA